MPDSCILYVYTFYIGGLKLARGTTFGCQNQSRGTNFGRRTEIFIIGPPLMLHTEGTALMFESKW